MNSYVLGFAFQDDGVWLIHKNHPEWQKGLWNGIGGKIKEDELALNAMIREFKEEAGLDVIPWVHYLTISDEKNYEVFCYHYKLPDDLYPKTMENEEVQWFNVNVLLKYNSHLVISNLNWMIPMAYKCPSDKYYVKQLI